MERRRAPAATRRYRQRRFWDALYRQEGAEPREWLGGLSRFLPQLEAELRPGDRILVLGTCPVTGGGRAGLGVPPVDSLAPAARGRCGTTPGRYRGQRPSRRCGQATGSV